jgi:hypothetical protein
LQQSSFAQRFSLWQNAPLALHSEVEMVRCLFFSFLCLLPCKLLCQQLAVKGVVLTGNAPVKRQQVQLRYASTVLTSNTGEFLIGNIPSTMQIGFPITFFVPGWVIEQPFVGERGRTYMPDPRAEPVEIHVRKAGDSALLSPQSIQNILLQRAYHFAGGVTGAAPVPASHAHLMSVSFGDVAASQSAPSPEWTLYLAEEAAAIGVPI